MSKTKNSGEERISLTEYGRRKGVSHTAVRRAIETGRLVKSVSVLANGKTVIDQKLADQEWAQNTDPNHWRTYSSKGGSNANEVDTAETKAASSAGLNAAKRAKAIFDAKNAELDYKKKAGQLVEKEKVYKALYDWGKELRNELLSIPDRIIDDMLSAPTRNDALTKLHDEISGVLEKLTNVEAREIVTDR